jgi:opacity protein-like surface antigen
MVDGVYHINAPGMSVKPYVGAGIGFAYATSKYDVDEDVYDRYGDYLGTRSVSTTDSSTNFCFNMMGGVEFPMSSTGSIVAQLDYLNFDTDVSSYSVKAFNLSVGYKFRF